MRKLFIFGLFLIGLPILAQPIVVPGQNFYVEATQPVGENLDRPVAILNNFSDVIIRNQTNDAAGWETEPFFEVNDSGNLRPIQPLFPLFNLANRAIVTFTLTVAAVDQTSATVSADETITVIVVQDLPYVIPGQIRYTTVDLDAGAAIGSDIQTVNTPTGFNIVSGNSDGLFEITEGGSIFTTQRLDTQGFTQDPTIFNLGITASNAAGTSPETTVSIEISVFDTNQCGYIAPDQVRFAPVTAVSGDNIGFPLEVQGLSSVSIDSGYIDTPPNFPVQVDPDIVTAFTIEDPVASDGTFGQIRVVQRLIDFIPDEAAQETYHKIVLTVRGFPADISCQNDSITQDISIYILPRGAGTSSGGDNPDGGTNNGGENPDDPVNETDFSVYIDDPNLESCIRENLGLRDEFPIDIQDLESLTQLDCFCSGINDLSGLQLFKQITFLNLQNNGIVQLQPISGLLNLTDLKLAGNLLYDLETDFPFASLTNLVRLDLSNNSITETSAFATLQNLQFITVANNNLCDIESLANNPGIGDPEDVIILDGNHLISQEALAQIGQIETRGPAFISYDNQTACPASRFIITTWPAEISVLDASQRINFRDLCPTGPNP